MIEEHSRVEESFIISSLFFFVLLSCLPFCFDSCAGDVLETGNVTFSVIHEGPLPHVLVNMEPEPGPEPDSSVLDPTLDDELAARRCSPAANSGGGESATAGVAPGRGPAPAATLAAATNGRRSSSGRGSDKRSSGSPTAAGDSSARGERAGVTNDRRSEGGEGVAEGGGRGSGIELREIEEREEKAARGGRMGGFRLPDIGPPKRVMLLPEVHPR